MKKLFLLVLLAVTGATAQDMTKDQTLEYIKTVYSQINRVYISSNTYKTYPQQLDSVTLEYDQLVMAFTIKNDDGEVKKTIRAKISGPLELTWDKLSLENSSGDRFMYVSEGNTAQLERLRNALLHLQKFIVKDPFSGN